MSRRLYGLSGLKLLLPRLCSWDFFGLCCLPWRAKRTRRAQQCSAIWRTTMPLSGPCLNGMLDSQKNRCRPIIRLFLRVFLYSGRNSTMASEKPDCRSDHAVAHADEVIATAARCMSLMGPKPEVRTPTRHVRCTPDSRHRYADRSGPFRARGDIGPSTSSQGGCSLFPQGVRLDCVSAT